MVDLKQLWDEQTPAEPLPAEMRLVLIRHLLEQRGFVRVRDLAERFSVSTVTVRNDLQVLEERQLAFRVHGGAMPFNQTRGERPVRGGRRAAGRREGGNCGHSCVARRER